MKNQLTTIASLPGSGSGCQSALPAEKPSEKSIEAEIISIEEGLKRAAEMLADALADVFAAYGEAMQSMMREYANDVIDAIAVSVECQDGDGWAKLQNFGGYPAIPAKTEREHSWTITRSAFEVEEAIAAGHAVEKLGPAMWKITRPADLLDAAGGGE